MIDELRIDSLGVIRQAELTFSPGLTAITGETGAGKTMLLSSLGLILGGPSDVTKVRKGIDRAVVDASFAVPADDDLMRRVQETGADIDVDGAIATVTVSRTLPREGRSRCYLGGRAVPRSVLQSLASELVAVHGQADQMRLRTRLAQLDAVDHGGGARLETARQAYEVCWAEYVQIRDELAAFEQNSHDFAKQRLALTALVDAVSKVNPEAGEEDSLKQKIDALDNLEERRMGLTRTLDALSGDGEQAGARDKVRRGVKALEPIDADLSERLDSLGRELDDVAHEVGRLLASLEITESIDDLQSRRAELIELSRSLGMSADEARIEAEKARVVLETMTDPGRARDEITTRLAKAKKRCVDAGRELHAERSAAARALSEAICVELRELALGRARVVIDVTESEPGPRGMSEVEFLLVPDEHSDPVSLASAASGGELSRIMLALELVLADMGESATPTFVFDEIDAGVGGEAAKAIGARLAALAMRSQVIVVTHLAQVASWADSHLVVERDAEGTRVREVTGADRQDEIARMLSGSVGLDSAQRHAADLIAESNVAL